MTLQDKKRLKQANQRVIELEARVAAALTIPEFHMYYTGWDMGANIMRDEFRAALTGADQ